MTSFHCPNCGQLISEEVAQCPNCGFVLARATDEDVPTTGSRQQKRLNESWQHKLIPTWDHLKTVWQFIQTNAFAIMIAYLLTLIFVPWRWLILVIYLLSVYLFPLLTGKSAFFGEGPLKVKTSQPSVGPVEDEPYDNQPQTVIPKAGKKSLIMPNNEFKFGSFLIIPSLIVFLVGRHALTRYGTATALFDHPSLGSMAYFYIIGFGLLGISVALVIGGFVKGLVHHYRGGARFKRWALMIAVLTMILAVGVYQIIAGNNASDLPTVLMTFCENLTHWLPWVAIILYGVGIVINMITPRRN